LGGEKLYRLYTIILIALFIGAGLIIPNALSAQTQEGEVLSDSVGPVSETEPNPESLIVFNAAAEDDEISAPETLSGFTALRMVLVLALVAAAIYGVVFFFRRLARPQAQENPHLKVLARASLGGNGAVAVVSVGTRAWLVGSGDSGTSLIAEIEDQELVDTMLLDNSRNGGDSPKLQSFAALLRRLGAGKEEKRLGVGDLRKRRERLDKL
jgi:flagellar protein FliO/FliZ